MPKKRRPTLLERLIEAQGGRCIFCGREVPKGEYGRNGKRRSRYATKEHIIPKSKGGTQDWSNMAMSCNICNNQRGDLPFSTFLALSAPERQWVLKHREVEECIYDAFERSPCPFPV